MKCTICGRNFDGDKVLEKWKEELKPKIIAKYPSLERKWEKVKVCGICLDKIERGEM